MSKLSKIALVALAVGAMVSCGSDDVEDFFVGNAGIDVNDNSEATTAAEMVVKSLELISQAAINCGANSGCGTGEYNVAGLSGELKVEVAGTNSTTGAVTYRVNSTGTFVDVNSGGMEFQVDLKTSSEMILTQQGSGAGTVWSVSMSKSNYIANKPDDALFFGQTKDDFQFDNGTGMLVDNMGSGILTGKDDKTREFTYTTGGNVNLN